MDEITTEDTNLDSVGGNESTSVPLLPPEQMQANQEEQRSEIERQEETILQDLYLLRESDEEDVERFIEICEESIQSRTFAGGNTIIHLAGIVGKPKLLRILIDKFPNIKDAKNEEGDTPIISIIKSCGFNLKNCLNGQNIFGKIDCEKHLECLDLLLANGANKEEANDKGLTAISYASMCIEKKTGYLSRLLRKGAIEKTVEELYKAIESKEDNEVSKNLRILYRKVYAKISNFMFNDKGKKYTLLQAVCKYGLLESAKDLISFKMDLCFTPLENHPPIQLSCMFNQPRILEYLLYLNNGNNLQDEKLLKTKNERNLFHLTVKKSRDNENSLECLKILLENKDEVGDINEQDVYKRTPLHYAAITNNNICVVELLRNGAYFEIEDIYENNPLIHISKPTFQEFLDSLITEKKIKVRDEAIVIDIAQREGKVSESIRNIANRDSIRSSPHAKRKKVREYIDDVVRKQYADFNKDYIKTFYFEKNEKKSLSFSKKTVIESQMYEKVTSDKQQNKCKIKVKKALSFNYRNFIRTHDKKLDYSEKFEKEFMIPLNLLYQIQRIKHLRELLAHPALSLILQYKWRQISFYYRVHLILFAFFCFYYSNYFLLTECEEGKNFINPKTNEDQNFNSTTLNSTLTLGNEKYSFKQILIIIWQIIQIFYLYLLLIFFLLIEIDIIKQKIGFKENSDSFVGTGFFILFIRPISIIVPLIALIVQHSGATKFCSQLKAISIVLIFFKLFITLGKDPNLTIFIKNFFSASLSSLFFAITHFAIIYGFAVCFHFLFQSAITEDENPFENFYTSIFKTLIMLTGDFDSNGSIPFDESPLLGRIIFILFIFAVIFVILNLLSSVLKPSKEMGYSLYLRKCLAKMNIMSTYHRHFKDSKLLPLFYTATLPPIFFEKKASPKDQESPKTRDNNSDVQDENDFTIIWEDEKKDFANHIVFCQTDMDHIQKNVPHETSNTLPLDQDILKYVIPQAWEIVAKRFKTN